MAGRGIDMTDLDIWIAKNVMRWHYHDQLGWCDGDTPTGYCKDDYTPSTDVAQALQALGVWCDGHMNRDYEITRYDVTLLFNDTVPEFSENSELFVKGFSEIIDGKLARAICLALKQALEK